MLSLYAEPEEMLTYDDSSVIPDKGVTNVVFICPFGSPCVPPNIGPLPAEDMWLRGSHIIADPHAEFFTQEISSHFQCMCISTRFSRIVADINLPCGHNSLIPIGYDRRKLKMNADISLENRKERVRIHSNFRDRCLQLIGEVCPLDHSIIIGIQTFPRIWAGRVVDFDINIMFTEKCKPKAQVFQRIFFERGLQASFNTPYSGKKEDGNALYYLDVAAGRDRDRVTLMFRADLLEIPYFRLTVLNAIGEALVQMNKLVRVGKKAFADYVPPEPGSSNKDFQTNT